MILFAILFTTLVVSADWTAADENGFNPSIRLSEADLREGLEAGQRYVADLERLETKLLQDQRNQVQEGTPSHTYARFKPFFPEALAQSKRAAVELVARQHLSERFGVPADQIDFKSVSDRSLSDRQSVTCDPNYPYRSADGTCNNLNNPLYGKSGTIFQRLLLPSYEDGVGKVRSGPSPRAISNGVVLNESLPEYTNTLITMQWGQFLDHDLTLTPAATFSNGTAINCCLGPRFGSLVSPSVHPECLPITIPSTDPLYSPANCMNFVRSTFGQNLDGTTPSSRQQINALTHWLDGSQVYGNNAADALALRDTTSGRGLLKTSTRDGRVLLPLRSTCCPGDPTNSCPAAQSCFFAGDARVNEQPLLTVMHTLWVREHNRVANELYKLFGSSFSDEVYYQQTRRIVIAEMQHITYTEYLPALIGWNILYSFPPWGPRPNPAIFNEFAAAAYRMGHSQIKSFIRLIDSTGVATNESYFLGNSFFGSARLLNPTFYDDALRGLLTTPVQKVDNCFADDITSQLFRTGGASLGSDLVSLNLQRGRDHGLPPYARYWRNSGFSQTNFLAPTSFRDLSFTTSDDMIAYLSRVYNSVNDIDLFIGAVTERPVYGGLVGPTLASIIEKQFNNLRFADRFFYNDLSQSVSFTSSQLSQIQRVSLAQVICDNSDISVIQPNAFRAPDMYLNPLAPCSKLRRMNLAAFRPVLTS